MASTCPICDSFVSSFLPGHNDVECTICGTYFSKEAFLLDLFNKWGRQKPDSEIGYLLSGVDREKAETGATPVLYNLDELRAQIPFQKRPSCFKRPYPSTAGCKMSEGIRS
jgi:hypothetical protein